jgi:hypothetical protein
MAVIAGKTSGFAFTDHLERGSDFFFHLLTGFEFDGGSCGNGHGFRRFFGVAPDLGLHFSDLKGSEIPHDHAVSLRERVRDFLDQGLHDRLHILLPNLGSLEAEFVGDVDNEVSFGYGEHGGFLEIYP